MQLPKRKPNRMDNYDYSSGWWYFITICTDNRIHHFGDIVDNIMNHTIAGHTAYTHWLQIPSIYWEYVDIDSFVVMPNHIHGIILLNGSWPSLSTIIKSYKQQCSKYIHQYTPEFARQKSFHDRIIRNQWEYDRISHYINTNIENRWKDTFNWPS